MGYPEKGQRAVVLTRIWFQNTISGTSMATPHITGLGAYLLALLGSKTPADLCQYIQNTATLGTITDDPAGTINAIAFNGNPNA